MWKIFEISRSRAKLSVAKLSTPKQFYQTSKALISRIIVNNVELQVEIDTGATISLMHVTNFRKFFPKLKLKQTNVQLSGVSAPVKVLGVCEVQVSVLEGIVVKQYGVGSPNYLVSIAGLFKKVHANQLTHTPLAM